MTYLLYLAFIGNVTAPQQIGPFKGLLACELASEQIKTVDNRVRATVCLSLNHNKPHWNGKELPK